MSDFEQAQLGVRMLGGFAVSVAGRPLDEAEWRLRRAKTLVKLLALAPQRQLHREQLTEALWPDSTPAANSLHQVLYTARRALSGAAADGDGSGPLALRDDVVALDADGLWIDVDAFEHASADARAEHEPHAYRAALTLYGGELLPEDRYEEWTTARRDALRETYLALLVELGELLAARGDVAEAVQTLQRAVVEDPLHEAAHRALIGLFAADGRRQQALAQYQQLRQALSQQLAAEPDPETTRLYRELLAGQHEPEPTSPSAPTSAAPQLRAPSGRLPHQLTSFVGRARELSELVPTVRRARLLTLTGPGGAGKTRLALELAARLQADFDEDVLLVELASIADAALVAEETATALGVHLRPQRDPIEALAERIADRNLLLVLDNCEHLLDAAVRLADGLLRACPNLRVLATSRERLRVPGEVAWRVPPLSLPGTDGSAPATTLDRYEAVSLFCQRATEAAPGFELTDDNAAAVAEICRRLDGMPLALELAAARAAALSVQQIAERLEDALGLLRGGSRAGLTRQQTLRATLVWSHDLLSESERVLYRRLGVFAGGFGLEAVEGICAGDGLPADEILDRLAALIDKSLVHVETGHGGEARYRLLETIRQDARERLDEAGEGRGVQAAHCAWYLALAEAANRDADLRAPAQWPAERVDGEYDNLRTALASAIRDDPVAALRLACALWWYWMARSYFSEGYRLFESALAGASEPTVDRARALVRLGAIDVRTSWVMRSVSLGSEALEIARALGDRHGEARALERLGVLAMGNFTWDAADDAFASGLELARELGDAPVATAITAGMGVLAACRGETDTARDLLREALARLEGSSDDHRPLYWPTHTSPMVTPTGRGGAPRFLFEDTFCLFRPTGAAAARGYLLLNIAETWRTDGDCDAAREPLELALATFEELGDNHGAGVALTALGNLAGQAGDAAAARGHFDRAMALRQAAGDPREIATTLLGQGMLELREGDTGTGLELVGRANAIFERTADVPGLTAVPLSVGTFWLDHDDPQRALGLLRQSAEEARERGVDQISGWTHLVLAEAALELSDAPAARSALDEALAALRRSRDRRGQQRAERLMSRA